MQRPDNDGSLNPIRDEIGSLNVRVANLNRKRRLDRDEIRQLRERVEVMMTFLDGMYNGSRRFHRVGLTEEAGDVDDV